MLLVLLLYIPMHIFVFTTYVPTPTSETVKLLAAMQWFVPTLLLVATIPRVSTLLDRFISIRYYAIGAVALMAVCATLQLIGLPGLWWAWSTMGLLIGLVFLVASANTSLGRTNALVLGIMVTLLAMGSWEAIYQTGLLWYHDFFGSGTINYIIVMAEQLTWIVPAVIFVLVMYQRHGYGPCIWRWPLICLAFSIICTVVWFGTGMEIPLYWWKGLGPFVNRDVNTCFIIVSRGSQTFWLLGIALLFRRRL